MTTTTTKHCVECGAGHAWEAERSGATVEVVDVPRRRGQTCEGWKGACRKTSRVEVTVRRGRA